MQRQKLISQLSLTSVDFLTLPTDILTVILDFSDLSVLAAICLTQRNQELISEYFGEEEKSSMVEGIAFLPALIEFRENLNEAIDNELKELNDKEQKRPLKKSTLGRIATVIGLGASSWAPYKVGAIGAARNAANKAFNAIRWNVVDSIKKNCWQALATVKNTRNPCEEIYEPYPQQPQIQCYCTFRSMFDECNSDPYFCSSVISDIEKCSASLWSNFTTACSDMSHNENGDWIILGSAVLATGLAITSMISFDLSKNLSIVSRDSIRINEQFIQKYFPDNEVVQYFIKKYITTEKTTYKVLSKLNNIINQFTCERNKVKSKSGLLPCSLFERSKQKAYLALEIYDDQRNDLKQPLLNQGTFRI